MLAMRLVQKQIGFNRRNVLLVALVGLIAAGCVSCGMAGSTSSDGGIPPFSLYWSVAVADLNGDGLPDIVTTFTFFASATEQTGSVAVYLQNAAQPGAFLSPTKYPVGNHPVAIAIGDLNGDGKPDIVTVNTILNSNDTSSAVNVLMQDASHPGHFSPAANYPTGRAPVAVAIGDLNGDGKPDLVVSDDSGLSLLLQDPSTPGSFLPRTTIPAGGATSSVAVADLNGDRLLDLVATTGTSVVVLLQNSNQPANFSAPSTYAAGLQPIWVAVSDLNGDGMPDLAVANLGNGSDGTTASLSVLLGDPTAPGKFLAASDYQTGSDSSFVAIADLNGDGKPDIAVANSGGLAGVCPPTCSLSGSLSVLLQEPASSGQFLSATNYAAQDQVLGVATADVNGDGKTDLVIDNGGGVVIRLQDPTQPGSFLEAVPIGN
jgi:hypothetical protein